MDPTLKDDMLFLGLYIFWNPAILDWRTWRKFGEHGEHGKHQPDKVKHSMIKNTLFMAQNTFLQRSSQQLKNHNIQGVSKKGTFLIFCVISVLEVGFYFSTCVSGSEF